MHWPKSKSSAAQPSPSMLPVHSNPSGAVGSNYQPEYLPHPAAVADPYTRHRNQPAHQDAPPREWLIPRLSLRMEDVSNPGVNIFLKNMRPYEDMKHAVTAVLQCLYTINTQPGLKCVRNRCSQSNISDYVLGVSPLLLLFYETFLA